MRRHDVDCLRVIALGLLIFYHAVVAFQPWAKDIFFIQNKETLEDLLGLPAQEAKQIHRADYDAWYQAHILIRLLERQRIVDP